MNQTEDRPLLPINWPLVWKTWDTAILDPFLARSYNARLAMAFIGGKPGADGTSISEFIRVLKLCWEPGALCKQMDVPKCLALWLLEEGVAVTLLATSGIYRIREEPGECS